MISRQKLQFARTLAATTFILIPGLNVLAQQPVVAKVGQLHTSAAPSVRVVKPVDNAKRVPLAGHVSSALRSATDLGRLAPGTKAESLVLVLSSSDEQKAELHRVLDQQQDKNSPNFHQWVTPEQFGEHFGASDADIAKVSAWLQSQGFTVDDVSKSKRVLRFSGTTGQLENAFATEMHSFQVGGEKHVANNSEISVPEALKPVIAGVTLNDFFRKGHMHNKRSIPKAQALTPDYTVSSTVHYVGPWDFATIYNTFPLLNKGINGTGSSIAVVGRSDILLSDVQNYRALFDLPNNDPIFIHAGQDNGIQPGDDGEADLDVEISGGYAPNAQIYFVIGTPTFLVDGITNSIEYIVENNVADIVSISYGSCESQEGAGGNEFNNQAFEQAAAQGMSVFVASGDNGPAECDNQNNSWEVYGYSTGGEASTPYSVSVGGSQGYETGTITNYWSSTTQSTPPYWGLSALGYIAEVPWNESKDADASKTTSSGLTGLWSGSGGISSYYIQPAWQRGSGVYSTDPAYTFGGNWVTGVTLTNAGTGYTTAPTVTFTGGGCVAEPTATATISGGAVTGIVFTYFTSAGAESTGQGFGCTSAPTVTFSAAASGPTATGTAAIGPMVNTPPLVSGVPHRYTPDLVLNAASGHDGTLFCSEGECATGSVGIVGGTSVAAPSMAGIQALINQANGGRQGMPGYIYYALSAAQTEANCNSINVPLNGTSTCAFHDLTSGDNLICGYTTCTTNTQKMGWQAGTGYDLASGLGSPNAYQLATQWSSVVFNSTATTLGLSQTSGIAQGTPVTISGTVAPNSGSGTPTGNVAFILSSGAIGQTIDVSGDANNGAFNGPTAVATLSNGSYSATLSNLPAGSYTLTARYGGDGTYASSLSTPVPVTVNSGNASLTITPQVINLSTCYINNGSTYSYASPAYITVNVASNTGAGVPTGTVTITVDGTPWGTVTLDPNGNGYLIAGNFGTAATSCLYDYLFSQGPLLAVGNHQIGASYSGDGTFSAIAASATPTVPVTVTTTPTTITQALGATTVSASSSVPLFVTISAITSGQSIGASAPTGTVTFTDTTTSTVLGTAAVTPVITVTDNLTGSAYPAYVYGATVNYAATGITGSGTHLITATYSGDGNYAGVTSSAGPVTVGTPTYTTTTTVTSSANPTTLTGRPTLTATIASSGGTAPTSGVVTFYDSYNGTPVLLGTASVGSSHTATFRPASSTAFGAGIHNITATYGGITADAPSTSPVFQETVNKGTGTFDVYDPKLAGLGSQVYAFVVALIPSPAGSGQYPLTGTVTFYDGATAIGTATPIGISAGQGGYGNWTASFTTALSVGTHSITAQYSDTNYTFTASTAYTLSVLASVPGRIWTANGNATTSYIGTTGSILTMGTAGTASTLGGVALDAAGDAWWVASANTKLYFSSTISAAPSTFTGGGLSAPAAVAVDGAGFVWVANSSAGTVSEFTNAGVALTGTTAYGATANGGTSGSQAGAGSIAIDNTGGVWVTNQAGNSVTHIIGAAAPVKPLSTAVTNSTLGAKP